MTSQQRAIEFTKLNVHAIFGETDATKRLHTISEVWAASGEVSFVEPMGVFKTHEAISDMVGRTQSLGSPGDEFVELSNVECLKHDEDEDGWVTRLKWGVGPKGLRPTTTGWDVLTIVRGKIKTCYTFLNA